MLRKRRGLLIAFFAISAFRSLSIAGDVQGIPIECEPGGKAYVSAQVTGARGRQSPARMLLDTGASAIVLDWDFARRAGIVLGKMKKTKGFAGRPKPVMESKVNRLEVGSAVAQGIDVLLMDLETTNRWRDVPIDGLLGMPFFRDKRFVLDPKARLLYWNASIKEGRRITLKPGRLSPFISIKVQGKTLDALLDTGAGGWLIVATTPDGVALETNCHTGAGVDGTTRRNMTRSEVDIFQEHFSGVSTIVSGSKEAIIGTGFLTGAPVEFDFQNGSIVLALGADGRLLGPYNDHVYVYGYCPVWWNRRNKEPFLEIAPLEPCDTWYKTGFREGDRLVKVGEKSAQSLSLKTLNEMLANGKSFPWLLLRKGLEVTCFNPPAEERELLLETPNRP